MQASPLSLALVTIAALLSVVAAGTAAAATAARDGPLDAIVVWGGKEHRTPESLEAWLRERGVSYETWARRHPGAAARLEAGPAPADHAHPIEAPPVSSAGVGAESKWTNHSGLLVLAVLGAGVLLLALGGLLSSPLALALPARRPMHALRGFSLEVAAAGVVAMVAAAVAYALAL